MWMPGGGALMPGEELLPGCASTLGSRRRTLAGRGLDSWRVDPACLGEGPLGAQRRVPHTTWTYTSEDWSLLGCASPPGAQVASMTLGPSRLRSECCPISAGLSGAQRTLSEQRLKSLEMVPW